MGKYYTGIEKQAHWRKGQKLYKVTLGKKMLVLEDGRWKKTKYYVKHFVRMREQGKDVERVNIDCSRKQEN